MYIDINCDEWVGKLLTIIYFNLITKDSFIYVVFFSKFHRIIEALFLINVK